MHTDFINNTINKLNDEKLIRKLRDVDGPQDAKIILNGKQVINFCSNNYLGLANDQRIIDSAIKCLNEEGIGSGASRLVCGNMSAHRRLERKIAEFKGTEACLVFSSGYMANVGIISSLFGRGDIIFSDKLNHASIVDGIILSRAEFKRYPHKDMFALEEMLKENYDYKSKCIVTDSVFSMDGDIVPLDKIVELAEKYNCMVMIDEAHALGVMGKRGKGLAEHFNVEDKIDIQMGTLSKSIGSFGAYCCGKKELIEFLINKARSFIYTTGMPPSVAAASMTSIEIISKEVSLRKKLWLNTNRVIKELSDIGFDTMDTQTPIIPILVKDSNIALRFSDRLIEEGIFISAIRPPTVPQNSARLRLTVMATHLKEDIDYLIDKLKMIGEELCLI